MLRYFIHQFLYYQPVYHYLFLLHLLGSLSSVLANCKYSQVNNSGFLSIFKVNRIIGRSCKESAVKLRENEIEREQLI